MAISRHSGTLGLIETGFSLSLEERNSRKRLLDDKIDEIFPSSSLYSGKKVPIRKEAEQQLLPEKPKRQLIVDVHGRTSEPVVPTKGVNTSFQLMVQATANVNIQQTRRWECSTNIHERDNDKTNRHRILTICKGRPVKISQTYEKSNRRRRIC